MRSVIPVPGGWGRRMAWIHQPTTWENLKKNTIIFKSTHFTAVLPRRLVRPLAVSLGTSSCLHHPGANKDFLFKTPEVTTGAGRLSLKDPRREAAMSDMVERTLTALPGLFLQNQLGGPAASRAPFFSRLGGLIRGVTALSSKHVGRQDGLAWAGPEAPVS